MDAMGSLANKKSKASVLLEDRTMSFRKRLKRDKALALMIVPSVLFFAVFCYGPMYGLIMAFVDFTPGLGFLKSPWVGLKWFGEFINGMYFWRLIRNTVLLNVLSIAFGFPLPIILALLLNEMRNLRFKRLVQSISYLPHFISTVIIVSLIYLIFSFPNGIVNNAISLFGIDPYNFMQSNDAFRPLFIGSGIWQELGWNSILYIAVLTSIDPGLYEAAIIDGANRFQQMIYISIPSMAVTIATVLILNVSGLFSIGYEKIILMYSPLTYETADVVSTYVYRKGILNANYSFATAVGLFNAVLNFALLFVVNTISKKTTKIGIW